MSIINRVMILIAAATTRQGMPDAVYLSEEKYVEFLLAYKERQAGILTLYSHLQEGGMMSLALAGVPIRCWDALAGVE